MKKTILSIAVLAFFATACQKDESSIINPSLDQTEETSSLNQNEKGNNLEQPKKGKNSNLKTTYTESSYAGMMEDLKDDIDAILLQSKPSELSLEQYKIELIDGNYTLSQSDEDDILSASQDLIDYGIFYANRENISIDTQDPEETIALGGLFSPEDTLEIDSLSGDSAYIYNGAELTWGDVGKCAAAAVGADLLWSLTTSDVGVGGWKRKALVKAFGKVASRFLGPIGVAIAVVSFSLCLGGIT